MRRITLVAALLLATPGWAQDAEPAKQEKAEKTVLGSDELAEEQAHVAVTLEKIEETMKRIAKILEKRNPDQAARLRMAWQRSKDDRNLEVIQEIQDLLREEYFNEAYERQKHLEQSLRRLLDILLDRDAERKDLQEKIQRLQTMSQNLERIIQEERDHQLKTEKFADPETTLQRAAAAKAKLSNLINRQNKLIEKTRSPEGDPAIAELREKVEALLKEQKALRGSNDANAQQAAAAKAAELAQQIAKHAQSMPDALKKDHLGRTNPADQAGNAMKRAESGMKDAAAKMAGGSDFQPSQDDAEQELREAADALKRLSERSAKHAEKKLVNDQERIRKDTERLKKEMQRLERSAEGQDAGSGELGKAGGKMEQAKKGLSKGNRDRALPHEQDAKEELEKALKKLEEFEKELKRLIKLPDYEKLEKAQEQTTEKTDDLLKKMKNEGGEQGGDNTGEPTPGQGSVEQGKKAMQRAQRNLRNKSAKGANSDQKEAIEQLEKAKEELDDALRQLREEEQLMLLEALERRLGRMLQKQTRLFKETLSLSNRLKDVKKVPRALVDKGAQLGQGESELGAEAEKILGILREEGTTVVIPDVLEDMQKDLDGLAVRLRRMKAGQYTQAVQRDVIDTLRELIEVIKEELNRRQGGGQGQGGEDGQEGDQDDDLLPTSAELKMLKSLQLRVNKRTSIFERLKVKEDDERTRISHKQEGTGNLTRKMADRLNREDDE